MINLTTDAPPEPAVESLPAAASTETVEREVVRPEVVQPEREGHDQQRHHNEGTSPERIMVPVPSPASFDQYE